ncbi:MAG: zinc-dependent alcohol dehydrogenase family protein [Acidobacteriota bacterium]|nr:MAG: zinc-dependent alcohol dehydrogenase family protein [Acidobacteriota bacterium]
MQAVIYEQFGAEPTIRTVPDPEPSEGSVVLEVRACGICRSDWHGWMGNDPDITLPHVPGHELSGVVAETGPGVRKWKTGDRVTVPFVGGCGACPQCRSGNQQVCDFQFQPGFTHWGGFAEFVEIRYADENLVALPEGIGFVTAASLGCRFMTSFRAVVHQGRTSAGEWVAVFGCGGVGLSSMMIAKALGARVVAVDIGPEKLEFARSLGADAAVLIRPDTDVPAVIREITGVGAAVSIDAIGMPSAVRDSVMSLAKRGRHVQIGLMEAGDSESPVPMNRIVAYELEMLGSHGMQAHRYPEMFSMIEEGRLEPGRLVNNTVALEEAGAVLIQMGEFPSTGISVIDRFR